MRVATFNILHGRSLSDGRVDISRFADAIRTLDADVLALQEVDRDQPRSMRADLTAVAAEAMGAVDYRFVAALAGAAGPTWRAATGREQKGTPSYGIALLSRYPALDWQVVRLPAPPLRMPMRIGQPRPTLVQDEARVAVAARIQAPGTPLLVATTHLSFVPGWNALQLWRLCRAMASAPQPVILMGDLNMEARRAVQITGLRALTTQPTFPAHAPSRQIDHILARAVSAAAPGEVVRLTVSDHLALAVNLAGFSDLAN
ncbi:MAG TPA: endonuclease/exonuclease/phosphatase family protein [Pseudonocardiaceae bacterium]|nr:endonuclease/exonuclease/phosphatase family protein [Pseudonocardiaceae bacterium]